MNILLTTETYLPYITGVSVSTDNIARFMISQGHNVTLICPKPLVRKSAEFPKGLKIIFTPSVPFSFYNNNAIAYPFSAKKIIEREIKTSEFDVIHIQEPGVIGQVTLNLAKKYNIPTIGSLHFIPQQIDRVLWGSLESIFTPIINLFIRTTYNKYDQIMTVSNFFADFLRSVGVTKLINIISNGVDTKLFSPSKHKLKEEKTMFFYLGRLDRDKNVETVVRAMPHTHKNVRLTVVGKGTESKYLLNLSEKLGVSQRLNWIPYVTNAQMVDLYKNNDVFVIMSPFEGQSIVTLQAVSCGLPVIAANAGALPELVHNKINGYLVKTYDHKSLAEKMNVLANSPGLRKKFGIQSRKISLKHKRSEVLRKLEGIYIMLNHAQR